MVGRVRVSFYSAFEAFSEKVFLSRFFLSAVAVYTGMETKMALNYQSKSQKRSAVEKYDDNRGIFMSL